MVANDEMLCYWTRVMDAAGAMLFGRRTYELMEDALPRESGPGLPKCGPSTFRDGPGEISPEISPEFRIGKESVPAATPRKVASPG